MTEETPARPKQENIWLNLGLNVLLPSILLMKGKGWFEKLGLQETLGFEMTPAKLLIIALAFPISYGIYDFVTRRKYNFFSVLGFVSILLSGGVGLFELNKDWIAVKEAAIPAIFGIAVLVSLKTPYPLIRTFLFNPEIFDVPKIESALKDKGTVSAFSKLMTRCTLYLAGSFAMSAVLNYGLARYFIKSESGTDPFNVEMGKMQLWSWPVITLPSMIVMIFALWQLLKGIHAFTGYEMEDVLIAGQIAQEKEAAAKTDEVVAAESAKTDAEGQA